jgi:hypothetical protein
VTHVTAARTGSRYLLFIDAGIRPRPGETKMIRFASLVLATVLFAGFAAPFLTTAAQIVA